MRPLAEAFAARDADEAIRMTDTLPQSLRGAWQAEVNAVRAKSDPTALAGLLADARAEPALSSTVQAVMTAALANPAMALAQLEGADEVTRTRVLSTALREWTSTDPVAAAKWAAGVSDPALRGPAVRTTARLWGLVFRNRSHVNVWPGILRTEEVHGQPCSTAGAGPGGS
jgi:hypothetical protein